MYTPAPRGQTLNNVTVAYNTADVEGNGSGDGGGVAGSGNFLIFNTIVGNNFDSSPAAGDKAPDCSTLGGLTARFTLIEVFEAADCMGFMPATNITGQDPQLETLARNGGNDPQPRPARGQPGDRRRGQRRRRRLRGRDQRGTSRPQRAGCDIGAFEATPALPNVRCGGLRATIVGNNRRNVLRGTPRRDVIAGRGGNDVIRGLGGDDFLCGGTGSDRVIGGKGRDIVEGQAGPDTLLRPAPAATGCGAPRAATGSSVERDATG